MDYLPLFCQLRGKVCLLVGAGEVAARKARLLLDAGARLRVCALTFSAPFYEWQQTGEAALLQQPFSPELLDECWLVIAATSDEKVNQQVSDAAEARRLFCNVVDAPTQASAIMPSIIDRSPLMIAVSSGGRAPVLARLLREKLEALLPQHLGQLATLAGTLRERVKQHYRTGAERRRFWEKLFVSDRLAQSLANNDAQQAEALTDALFAQPLDNRGEVVLVGAGPGDAGLLTLKGLQQIQQADIVVYDRLVSDEVLALARRDAERIFVGKRAGHHCVPQEEINQILLQQAQRGKRVVRLKGGRQQYSLLGSARHYRRLRLLGLQRHSADAPRPCAQRALRYRPSQTGLCPGLGQPGGGAADAGLLYGAVTGRRDPTATTGARHGGFHAGGAGGKRHQHASARGVRRTASAGNAGGAGQ